MIDRIRRDDGWRYVFTVSLALAALSFVGTFFQSVVRKSAFLPQTPYTRVPLGLWRADVFLLSGAMVCLHLALYFGPMESWRGAKVISLFVAGFGGCGALWCISQSVQPASMAGLFFSLDAERALNILLTFLWGVSYQSFIHFTRKLSPCCRVAI